MYRWAQTPGPAREPNKHEFTALPKPQVHQLCKGLAEVAAGQMPKIGAASLLVRDPTIEPRVARQRAQVNDCTATQNTIGGLDRHAACSDRTGRGER